MRFARAAASATAAAAFSSALVVGAAAPAGAEPNGPAPAAVTVGEPDPRPTESSWLHQLIQNSDMVCQKGPEKVDCEVKRQAVHEFLSGS